MMILIRYFDWFGTNEALEKEREAWIKASKEMEGINSIRLVTSYQARYHYAWMIETDSYDNLQELNSRARKYNPRDKKVLTHTIVEIFDEL